MIIAFGILIVLLVVLDIVLIFALKESNKIYEVLIERLTQRNGDDREEEKQVDRLTGWFGSYYTHDPIDIYENDYSQHNFAKVVDKLGKYEDAEERGQIIQLPCKVGDRVRLLVACEFIERTRDMETGEIICPFEGTCEFDECEESNEREVISTVERIWSDEFGWQFTVTGMNGEIPVTDIGKYVFLEED